MLDITRWVMNNIENTSKITDEYIKRRLFEETGVSIKSEEDVFNLQKQYCILLYCIDDVRINKKKIYRQFVLEVGLPNPDQHGVHYMTILDNTIRFYKDNDGRWVSINQKEEI